MIAFRTLWESLWANHKNYEVWGRGRGDSPWIRLGPDFKDAQDAVKFVDMMWCDVDEISQVCVTIKRAASCPYVYLCTADFWGVIYEQTAYRIFPLQYQKGIK